MHARAPSTAQVTPWRTISTLDSAPSGGVHRGIVHVDLHDPVFFDHPLDHVPGMLLVVAGLELAEHAAMLRSGNVSFRLTFTRFSELDTPIEVHATREIEASPFEFVQSGHNTARGLLGRRQTAPPVELGSAPALDNGSIPGELVHRTDPVNIAISGLTVDAGRVWVRVDERAAISGIGPRASAVVSVIEAARQFVIAILHTWGHHPPGTKIIFVGLTADVPTAPQRAHTTRALSWQPTPPDQTRKLHIDVHTIGDRAIKVGSVIIATRCVDEVEYARLRTGRT